MMIIFNQWLFNGLSQWIDNWWDGYQWLFNGIINGYSMVYRYSMVIWYGLSQLSQWMINHWDQWLLNALSQWIQWIVNGVTIISRFNDSMDGDENGMVIGWIIGIEVYLGWMGLWWENLITISNQIDIKDNMVYLG